MQLVFVLVSQENIRFFVQSYKTWILNQPTWKLVLIKYFTLVGLAAVQENNPFLSPQKPVFSFESNPWFIWFSA